MDGDGVEVELVEVVASRVGPCGGRHSGSLREAWGPAGSACATGTTAHALAQSGKPTKK